MRAPALPDFSEHMLDARRSLRDAEEAGHASEWAGMARAADEAAGSCAQVAHWARRQGPRRVEHWNRTGNKPVCDLSIELGADDRASAELRRARMAIDRELAAELADLGAPARQYSLRDLIGASVLGSLGMLNAFVWLFEWTWH